MVAIDGTKSGETIRMAFFSLTVGNFSDKLIAAYNRGVNVRLIQDDHEIGPMWQDLVDVLGSDTTKKSWAVVCHRSCHSDENPSYMHAKIYLFSKTKSLSKVTMVCSCNPTYTQARVGWNDMYTWIGDATIYEGGIRYFEDLTAGAVEDANGDQTIGIPQDAYFSVASGKTQMWFFPKAGEGPEEDPVFQMLRDVDCIGTSPGYGSLGRTIIKVAMYQWSVRRDRIAHRLWDLSQEGCWVDVVYDQTATDKEVIDVLKTPGEGFYPIPTVTKSSEDKNDDGDFEHFVDHFNHEKYVLINGIYEGDSEHEARHLRDRELDEHRAPVRQRDHVHDRGQLGLQRLPRAVRDDEGVGAGPPDEVARERAVPVRPQWRRRRRGCARPRSPASCGESRNEFLPTEWE